MELSYRLNETEPRTILYYGINQELHFQLPAGYEENDRRGLYPCCYGDAPGICNVFMVY